MSVTELQVIHRHTTKSAKTTPNRFLLPNGKDDMGLVMKLDSKSKEMTLISQPTSPISVPVVGVQMQNASAVRPSAVSSQLCGQSHEVTGWLLRGALFLQTAHIPFIKFTHKMSEMIQRKMQLLVPVFFYMSLLVLVAQASAVVMLFIQSFLPMGCVFLLCCIGILSGMYVYTALRSDQTSKSLSRSKLL